METHGGEKMDPPKSRAGREAQPLLSGNSREFPRPEGDWGYGDATPQGARIKSSLKDR